MYDRYLQGQDVLAVKLQISLPRCHLFHPKKKKEENTKKMI